MRKLPIDRWWDTYNAALSGLSTLDYTIERTNDLATKAANAALGGDETECEGWSLAEMDEPQKVVVVPAPVTPVAPIDPVTAQIRELRAQRERELDHVERGKLTQQIQRLQTRGAE